MPKVIDHLDRRREIAFTTVRLIGESGLRALSFRRLAEALGGSVTLVTHYYPSRKALIDDLATQLIAAWQSELEEIQAGTEDPQVRLRQLVEWLLPLDERGRLEERARINLLAERNLGAKTHGVFVEFDAEMRALLRHHLEELVPASEVEAGVELLRVVTNGISLAAVEHPQAWTRKRQLSALDYVLRLLGFGMDSTDSMSA